MDRLDLEPQAGGVARVLRRTRIGLLLIAVWALGSAPAWSQDSVEQMGEQRLADARIFLQDGEWDAALVALEEATWYFPEGDARLGDVKAARNEAKAGKARTRADQAMNAGDYKTAVRKYEESLRYFDDGATRGKLQQAQDALAAVEPATPEPATPEPATPEPATPEPSTPEPSTPEPEAETEPERSGDPAETERSGDPAETEPERSGDPAEAETAAEAETGPEPTTADDGVAGVDTNGTHGSTSGGGATGTGARTPWGWLLALLGVVALGVIGTRTPVLAGLAGALHSAGSQGGALALYGVVERRGGITPEIRHAQVECLLALERFDDEARQTYDRAIGQALPPETTVRLAKLYAQRGIEGDGAARLYRLATEHDDDPVLFEALERCTAEDDLEGRLSVAKKLIAADRPTPERLLLVVEQYDGGEPDEQLRRALPQALQVAGRDDALGERRAALVDRLLPAYQEAGLKGEDAVALRRAYLESVDRREPHRGAGHRMVGPRAHRARVILADLSRLMWEADQGEALFELHRELLRRFRAEPFLLDGLMQVSADIEAYDRGIEAIEALFPPDDEEADAALTVKVATAYMLAATRNLRARADHVGADSGEFPGLTLLALAQRRLASLTVEACHRPDVRERLDLFAELYQANSEHLLPLDATLAELLWSVGNYPGAASLFLYCCGLEPHPVDGGLLVVPTDLRPPFSELFPEEMSTLVEVIGDRPLHREDVQKLAYRARSGVMNPYLALLVGVAPFPDDVRQAAGEQGPPVIVIDWGEIQASLTAGHARETMRRVIADRSPYPLSRPTPSVDLDEDQLFGRGQPRAGLRAAVLDPDAARVRVISGLRGVGKSTLVQTTLRPPTLPPAGWLVPRPDPELYTPAAWLDLIGSLYQDARHKGRVRPGRVFPERALVVEPGSPASRYVSAFRALREHLVLDGGAPPVAVIDPVDRLIPLEDPLAEDGHRAEGAETLLEALVQLAAAGELTLLLISRDIGCVFRGAVGGHPLALPESTDELVLGLLDDGSGRTALDRLLHDLGIAAESDALAELDEATGGHPAMLWRVVDEAARRRARLTEPLTTGDAEELLQRVLRQNAFERLAWALWSDLSPGARAVTRAFAAAEEGVLDAAAVAAALADTGYAAETEALLDDLSRSTLVTPRQGEGYQLRIGLLRRFLADPPPFP